ncbi:MAG: GntR family transcriptional regulator [Hyphomicrobiaceae bacterium]|nr:GntR family transcriptional regulator [Hyphomicrobiaceae bacterium]
MAQGSTTPTATRKRAAVRRTRGADGRQARPATSLTERAYRHLEELIVTLQLAPGAAVSENELSERLGIGRTPIREALQRLARERLVTILPRRGIIVSEVNVRSQLRLLELRREVERLVVRCAARRASPEERARFADLADQFETSARENDDTTFLRIDREFNELSVSAARNEYATLSMGLMQALSRRFWYLNYKKAANLPETAMLHASIARGIAAGDSNAAGAATDRLMDQIEAFTRATLDADF